MRFPNPKSEFKSELYNKKYVAIRLLDLLRISLPRCDSDVVADVGHLPNVFVM